MSWHLTKKILLAYFSVASALTALPGSSQAQVPTTIKLVVPYPPGGSVDTLARFLQAPLQEQLKTTVIVENKPGAGGRIAASQVKREPADGSVVLIAPNALTTMQSLVYAGRLDYSVVDDFTPVSRLVAYPFGIAVAANSAVKTVSDMRKHIKASPDNANYGTSGAGGMAHFSGLAFAKAAGLEWNHIAFKGGAPLITDLIGGHIPYAVDTLIDQIEHHRAGKIRVLGVLSSNRFPLAADIPTFSEQGVTNLPSIEGWFGAFVPAKTPKEMVSKLDMAFAKILSDASLKAKLNKMVIEVSYLQSSEFTALQKNELQQWAPVVKESGFKPE